MDMVYARHASDEQLRIKYWNVHTVDVNSLKAKLSDIFAIFLNIKDSIWDSIWDSRDFIQDFWDFFQDFQDF